MVSTGVRQRIRDINFYLILIIFISTLGPLQFGFHLSELNAPRDILTCKQRSVAEDLRSRPYANLPQCIAMNEAEFASLSSIFVVGGLIGAVSSSPASASYGRLLLMRITSLLFILGSTLETLAGTVPIMSIGRFLAGAGAGASTVVVPLYISEVAPPKERGFFGSMTQVMIGVGILLTQSLGYFLSRGRCGGYTWGRSMYRTRTRHRTLLRPRKSRVASSAQKPPPCDTNATKNPWT